MVILSLRLRRCVEVGAHALHHHLERHAVVAALGDDDVGPADGLKKSSVHQGYLEMSNVQVADEMVNMIVAQRAYEMNSKAIQATDEMLQQANNLRR